MATLALAPFGLVVPLESPVPFVASVVPGCSSLQVLGPFWPRRHAHTGRPLTVPSRDQEGALLPPAHLLPIACRRDDSEPSSLDSSRWWLGLCVLPCVSGFAPVAQRRPSVTSSCVRSPGALLPTLGHPLLSLSASHLPSRPSQPVGRMSLPHESLGGMLLSGIGCSRGPPPRTASLGGSCGGEWPLPSGPPPAQGCPP